MPESSKRIDYEICILAGGLSSRMGRDKTRVRLGRRTMLGEIRQVARKLGRPVRVIRRDPVPHCGPVGGICGALKTCRAGAVVFLACDMPFVTPALIAEIVKRTQPSDTAVVVKEGNRCGFPLVIRKIALPEVALQLAEKDASLQTLATRLKARNWRPPRTMRWQFRNVNTPEDLKIARKMWRIREGKNADRSATRPSAKRWPPT